MDHPVVTGADTPRGRRQTAMCRIHPEVVRAVADRTGGRERIMQTLGISWNSWVKIAAGNPVRRSVAERFRERAARAVEIECEAILIDDGKGNDA